MSFGLRGGAAKVSVNRSENMPKVSVIIPNYNHARFLRQRIESVFGQTFQDFEVILLDDCSTDESQSILSSYSANSRVRIEFNHANSGSTFKQWNKGVRLARGEYVWIAESDDYADVRLLEKLVLLLDTDHSAALTYCRSWRILADDQIDGFLDDYFTDLDMHRWTADFSSDGREECQHYLVHRNTVPNASAVLFRREVYERVGGADESLVLCGDWKLWASMALTGRIAYLGEPLNYNRFHNTSVRAKSQRLGVDAAEYLDVIRWILQRVTPSEAARTKLCEDVSSLWAPAVLTRHIPLSRRLAILENARAIDRHALRRLVRPALTALRMTLSRRYHSLRVGSSKSRAEETGSQAESKSSKLTN
jgi:glycosyltransferase involved in cell wall biosynthesis